jgi:hypothetical protein
MRSILDDGEVTKDGNEGEEWSKTWNEEMKACKGASWTADDDAEVEGQEEAAVEEELVDESEGGEIETSKKKHKKPKPSACSPISVIYVRPSLPLIPFPSRSIPRLLSLSLLFQLACLPFSYHSFHVRSAGPCRRKGLRHPPLLLRPRLWLRLRSPAHRSRPG